MLAIDETQRLCRDARAKGNLVADAYRAPLAIELGCELVTTELIGTTAAFRGSAGEARPTDLRRRVQLDLGVVSGRAGEARVAGDEWRGEELRQRDVARVVRAVRVSKLPDPLREWAVRIET